MFEINDTMFQENRKEIWCVTCKNENTEQCKNCVLDCVLAGLPTRYRLKSLKSSGSNYNKGEREVIQNELLD